MPQNIHPHNGQEEGRDDESGYKHQIRETKRAETQSKSGCIPKLFMLLLPFAAVAAYLLVRS